jgi:hypothetical protein
VRDLTATEVDEWLATLAALLSTRTIQGARACLNRAVRPEMARDKVRRNVVACGWIDHGTNRGPAPISPPIKMSA